jgi:6-phosphofructokinase 1
MTENLLVVHGGGPTPVINASLYGVIREAGRSPRIGKVFGAIGGTAAIMSETFLDLTAFPDEKLQLLMQTPASAIGSSRYPVTEDDYQRMPEIFRKHHIRYVLLNGGNGTMDTCHRIYEVCKDKDILVVGIPKTIDNDIALTDHVPGFGSAARYLAVTTHEVGEDVKSMPIHVSIIESMGRNAGWITAASALARREKGDAPDLIYVPERPFHEEEFLEDVARIHKEKGGVVVVASEGLKNEKGEPIVPPIFKSDRAIYYGDVGTYLAELVIKKLGIKARSEKPGICGRAAVGLRSQVDVDEAKMAGELAVRAVLEGKSGVMVAFKRAEGETYQITPTLVPLKDVSLYERKLPESYINERGNDITDAFVQWCRPLIGEPVPEFLNFKDYIKDNGEDF